MSAEGQTIPQMREVIEQRDKTIADLTAKYQESQTQVRAFQARTALEEAGYNPKLSKMLVSHVGDGDIDEDAVASFVTEFELTPISKGASDAPATEQTENDTATEEPQESESASTSLSGLSRAGSHSGDGGQQAAGIEKMSRDDWLELNKQNPVAAGQALSEGQVEMRPDNFWVQNVLDRR